MENKVLKLFVDIHPEFVTASEEERYQMIDDITKEEMNEIDIKLGEDVLGRTISIEEDEYGFRTDDLTIAENNTINPYWCLFGGVGNDYFYVNEIGVSRVDTLKYDTIYDLDYTAEKIQHGYRLEEYERLEDDGPKTFNAEFTYDEMSMYGTWIRTIENDELVYTSLSSVRSYIREELEKLTNDIIDKLIPNELVAKEDHGKETDGGYLWNMGYVANGDEDLLDSAKLLADGFVLGCSIGMAEHYKSSNESDVFEVFVDEVGNDDKHNRSLIFTNIHALKAISILNFSRDIKSNANPEGFVNLTNMIVEAGHNFENMLLLQLTSWKNQRGIDDGEV